MSLIHLSLWPSSLGLLLMPLLSVQVFAQEVSPPAVTTSPPAAPASPPVTSPSGRVTLFGQVLEAGTRKPLAGVKLQVEGTALETRSDEAGQFQFQEVPAGTVSIQLSKKGFETLLLEAVIEEGRQTQATWYLYPRADGGASSFAIEVVERRSTEVLQHSFTMEEVRNTPGTFGDPLRVVQNLPGVARAPFGLGLLIVRGTGPNDTGTYLDGQSVPIIYHFGGLISVYSPSMLERIDYLPGGYSARYGRTLGGVIDVATKEGLPDRTGGHVDINLMDSSAFLEGSVGKLGYAVAARRSYIDILANPLLESTQGLQVQFPRYWDAQLKLDFLPSDRDRFQLFFSASDDRFAILGNAAESQEEGAEEATTLSTSTTTLRAKLSWSHHLGPQAFNRLDVSLGPDDLNTSFGSGEIRNNPFYLFARDELSFVPAPWVTVKAGVDAQVTHSRFTLDLPTQGGTADSDASTDATDETDETPDETTDETDETDAWGFAPAPYLEADLSLGRRLRVVPGLRVDPLIIPDLYSKATVDPRLAARFRLTDSAVLKGSIGQYSQFPEYSQLLGDTGTLELEPAHALQSTLGFEWDISHQFYLDVVGYYNHMTDLVVSNSALGGAFGAGGGGNTAPDAETNPEALEDEPFYTNDGLGRSYGLEVLLRHNFGQRLYGWVSYSLSRSERKNVEEEDWTLYAFDQPHNLTAVAGYKLPKGWEISARYRYGSGNPYTPVVNSYQNLDNDSWLSVEGETNSARNDAFSQLDVRIQKDWTFKTWKLQGYLDIQNVTNNANAEATFYNYDFRDTSVITGLPFLPVLGFRGTF